MIGETLGGKYRIERLVGQGGMGAVYEGLHTGTGRRVAIKVITAGLEARPALLARFEVEARAAGKIESRHIAQIFDVGRDESRGLPYMVMEYLVGEDMQQLIRRLGPLPPSLAVRIVAQACSGLEKAHAKGILHRDIKPANIFLSHQEDDAVVVKIVDFGVAKIRSEDSLPGEGALTSTGALLGSPLYMSPEQARGSKNLDARSDVWALGVVLFQGLTGHTPFQHIEAMGELIISLCSTPAPPVDELSPWVDARLSRIVAKALEIPVERRFQSAREMAAALKELCKGTSIEAHMLVGIPEDERSGIVPLAGPTPPPGSESGDLLAPRIAATSTQTSTAVTANGASSKTGKTQAESKSSSKPWVVVAAIGAVAIAATAFFALRSGGGPAPAHGQDTAEQGAASPPVPSAPTSPSEAKSASAAAAAPTVAPAVSAELKDEPVSSAVANAPTGDVSASGRPVLKGKMPVAKPTATQAVTPPSVGGRVIRTDLP